MISIDHLTIQFGDYKAVNDLCLQIPQGELFGFLGPNGAGKTTTIKALVGSYKPARGTITVNQYSIPAQLEKAKQYFGYVPDMDNHIPEFTGRQNLRFYANLYGIKKQAVDQVLDQLELSEAADLKVRRYSRGMKKKLMIARETMHNPKVIYFDEPTANLDAHSTELVRKLLQELTAQGTTIFLTTHNMKEVEQICDRVAIIAKGKLIECDTPTSFITRHAERRVAIQYEDRGGTKRELLDLDKQSERDHLAEIICHNNTVRIHSQEFNFEDVFLKLTGEKYV